MARGHRVLACSEIGNNHWNNRIVSIIGEFKLCSVCLLSYKPYIESNQNQKVRPGKFQNLLRSQMSNNM